MKLRKILSIILALTMVLTSMGTVVLAENNNSTTFEDFVSAVIKADGTYDGDGITVVIEPASGDARKEGYPVPNRLQKYSNPEVYYAQYQRFETLADVNISDVNFVFVPVAVEVVDPWNTTGATTNKDNINGEIQFMNKGAVTLTNCSFDKVSVSPINATSVAVSGCSFANLDAYAIKDIKAAEVSVTGTSFEACNGGFWLSAAPKSILVTDNKFTDVGRRGAIQFSANGDYTETKMDISDNTVTGGALLWQLNETVSYDNVADILENNTYETDVVSGSVKYVAAVNGVGYTDVAKAIAATKDGDTVKIAAGEYKPINISNKNITIEGTLGADGEYLTVIKGGNPAITGHGFNGTIKDLKIVDAFKVMYAEPAGNVTVDNVYVTGATYGLHLVAYAKGLDWTIQNSYMDLAWANSFGVYGGGYADIVIKNNKFEATKPYYPDYGALAVNSFSPNVTVEDNNFGEGAKIFIDAGAVKDTSNIKIGTNYYADGVENAFADDVDGVTVKINDWYETEDMGNVVVDSSNVAKIGDEYYTSLQKAIAAADGDTITIINDIKLIESVTVAAGKNATLDLNGKTISGTHGTDYSMIHVFNGAELTVKDTTTEKNGKITCAAGGNNIGAAVWVEGKLTLESGTIEVTGDWTLGFAVDLRPNAWGTAHTVGASFVMNDGTVKSTDTAVRVASNSSDSYPELGVTFTMNNGSIDSTWDAIFVQHLYAGDLNINVVNGTVSGENSAMRIYGDAGSDIAMNVTGGEFEGNIKVADAYEDANAIVISGGSYSSNVSAYLADGVGLSKTANGYMAVDNSEFAGTVSVEYKDITEKDTEGEETYEIVLKAGNQGKIHELASVDLSFVYSKVPVTGGSIDFTVLPAKDFTMTRYGKTDRYMFNYNGTTASEGTDSEITVGTITVSGYGKYTIATADVDTNVVNTTTVSDNLVTSYTVAGANDNDATTGALDISAKVDGDDAIIAVPVRTLTINLDFPNAVEDKEIAYQDMKVEITGVIDGVNQTITYDLGKDGKYAMNANGSYVVKEDRLVRDNAYTVTVSGAGYRTARYTVTMTENKTLRFWNNVMDEAQFVEIGENSSKVNVTFLAGDIVKDNKINIYDLSAVVSYFGAKATTENKYAKYDLNRDGVVDSKDVAYVLVSWDN